jgi:hypothetical protein
VFFRSCCRFSFDHCIVWSVRRFMAQWLIVNYFHKHKYVKNISYFSGICNLKFMISQFNKTYLSYLNHRWK